MKEPAMYKFNSQIQFGSKLPHFDQGTVKNEPMFFRSNFAFAHFNGGPITKSFLEALPHDFRSADDLVIDSRVHMLMAGWWPCIPGYHHDDVPRTRSDGQPNYINPAYKAEHCLALIGDCCPTQFALGQAEFPEVPIGGIYYKEWHPLVVAKINSGELEKFDCPSERLVLFDWHTWHQGTKARHKGFRWFIRATKNTGEKPSNEIRRNANVYMEAPMEGW